MPIKRYQIESLIKAGLTQTQTALIVGVHRSIICRRQRNIPTRGRTAGQ